MESGPGPARPTTGRSSYRIVQLAPGAAGLSGLVTEQSATDEELHLIPYTKEETDGLRVGIPGRARCAAPGRAIFSRLPLSPRSV